MLTEIKVINIISKFVGEKVDLKSTSSQIENWDSLAQLNILASLDKLTKGKSSKLDKLTDATSVKTIINILTKANLIKKK